MINNRPQFTVALAQTGLLYNPDLKVYIAGPITNKENYNQKQFDMAQQFLEIWQFKNIFNPLREQLKNTDIGWHACMKRDIPILTQCSAIFVLPDWFYSEGVNLELLIAIKLKIPVFFFQCQSIDDEMLNHPVLTPHQQLIKLLNFELIWSTNNHEPVKATA